MIWCWVVYAIETLQVPLVCLRCLEIKVLNNATELHYLAEKLGSKLNISEIQSAYQFTDKHLWCIRYTLHIFRHSVLLGVNPSQGKSQHIYWNYLSRNWNIVISTILFCNRYSQMFNEYEIYKPYIWYMSIYINWTLYK